MGMDFLLNVVAIQADREPDWEAATRRIDALRLETSIASSATGITTEAAGRRQPRTPSMCRG